jgi:hypothetical protein
MISPTVAGQADGGSSNMVVVDDHATNWHPLEQFGYPVGEAIHTP